ncbi:hypothetical protein DYB37_009730 [Aphanomyces astaci]|uniref:Uncharacterized protein n=1 Tax=Aphanomyces astaci TaxID=112090 RepID=A0A3R6YG96_APHAT|nr:hypothetical protein DYB37_009730 [Aphanomyces astaci]
MRTAGAYDIRPDIATVTQKRHQEGTAVPATSSGHTEVAVDYQNHTRTFSQPSTSTHHECSAGSFLPTSGPLPAAPLIHPHAARSPTHTTTTMDPPTREKAADHPAPPTNGATTAAVVWAHEPPAADSYDPTTARFPQLTPNPNLPTTQAPQVAAVSTIHLGEAAIEVDIDTHGAEPDTAPQAPTTPTWDIVDQLSSPRAEQPTPRDHSPQAPIDSPITTLDVDMDGPEPEPGPQAAPTPPTSRILPRLQTQDTVFTNLQPSDVDMDGPLDGDTPQGVIDPDHNTPTADDLLATLQTPRASPSMMALGITRTVATARPTIDISETPAPQTARIDYAHSGTLQTLIGGRSWQEGTVAALGQCCVLALHCAKHGHGWSARSHHDELTISAIHDLKTAMRDMVQAHEAFTGHYLSRWLQQLADTSTPSQESVQDYIRLFFDRLIAAHPAQGIPKRDWCGYPEIAAAAAVWGHPVYVLQEQSHENTWWMWRVGYTHGATDIYKEPIPPTEWEATMAAFAPTTVLLAHKGGSHFDPIHMTPPRSAPAPVMKPLLQPSRKLPVNYAKAATVWIANNGEDLPCGKFPVPITTVADVIPLFTDFPRAARGMLLWALRNPATLVSKMPSQVVLDWGDHMLLDIVHTTMDAIRALHNHPALHVRLDTWKDAILEAPTLPLAMAETLDEARWSSLTQGAEIPLDIFDHTIFTALSPKQLQWAAIVAALLDKEGYEIDELPPLLTLGDLLLTVRLGDMVEILNLLPQGKWTRLRPWMEVHAFAWGYSPSGYQE